MQIHIRIVLVLLWCEALLVTKSISKIVKVAHLKLLTFHICADHIHLLIVCNMEQIPAIMQKIKAVTSKVSRWEQDKASEQGVTREHASLLNKNLYGNKNTVHQKKLQQKTN